MLDTWLIRHIREMSEECEGSDPILWQKGRVVSKNARTRRELRGTKWTEPRLSRVKRGLNEDVARRRENSGNEERSDRFVCDNERLDVYILRA